MATIKGLFSNMESIASFHGEDDDMIHTLDVDEMILTKIVACVVSYPWLDHMNAYYLISHILYHVHMHTLDGMSDMFISSSHVMC